LPIEQAAISRVALIRVRASGAAIAVIMVMIASRFADTSLSRYRIISCKLQQLFFDIV
jgi:hypothetical protein